MINYANFQDFGYIGLYGGLRQKDIHAKKKLKKNEAILDHMGSEESQSGFFVSVAPQNDTKLLNFNPMAQTKISDDNPLNNLDTDDI